MRVYPKLPRYDHPVVPASFYGTDDLTLLEKYDGSSFRFTLYDDRYADSYPEAVRDAATGDGGLVFGTRRSIRGCHRTAMDEIDGALRRAVRCLRDGIDESALRSYHEVFDSPLIVYAENLVYSSLDYGFSDRKFPALIGFDVVPYSAVETMTPPGNPYEETFDGFLDLETAWERFDAIRIEDAPTAVSFVPATIVDRPTDGFDPDEYDVPQSSLAADVRMEGVVVRSDEQCCRAKIVRDEFEELNRKRFGQDPADAETGAEYVVATYCTPARIRKQVRTLLVEEGRAFGCHLNEDLYPRVVEDIWAEHWPELMELDVAFRPTDVYPLVAERCIAELRAMETNAELNDVDPTTFWRHLSYGSGGTRSLDLQVAVAGTAVTVCVFGPLEFELDAEFARAVCWPLAFGFHLERGLCGRVHGDGLASRCQRDRLAGVQFVGDGSEGRRDIFPGPAGLGFEEHFFGHTRE